MDTITQGLLGAITAELGFRQRLGKGATLAAALVASTPDLDIFAPRPLAWLGYTPSGDAWHTIHRGPTHALVMIPVIALIFTAGWWALRRWSPLKRRRLARGRPAAFDPDHPPGGFGLMFAAMIVAVATHCLLDLTTTWGTQILWPFTTTRYSVDMMPIVDIFYTPILLIGVVTCWLIRKFKDHPRRATLIAGWIAFGLSMAYIATAGALNRAAVARAAQTAPQVAGVDADQITYRAYPQIGTIFLWRVTARGPGLWMATQMNFISGRDGPPVWTRVTDTDDRWVQAARTTPGARHFEWFAQGFTRADSHQNPDGSHVVTFYDMRYGTTVGGVDSHRSLQVVFDPDGHVTAARRVRHFGSRGGRGERIRRYWRAIWGRRDNKS